MTAQKIANVNIPPEMVMEIATYVLCIVQTYIKIPITRVTVAIATMRETNRRIMGIVRSAHPPGRKIECVLWVVLRAIKAAARPERHPAINDMKVEVYQHEFILSWAEIGRAHV